MAWEVLQQASTFENASVGEGGETSYPAIALRQLLRRPDARDVFRALLQEAKHDAGRLYALWGLRESDPDAYRRFAASDRGSSKKIRVFSGCSLFSSTVGELLGQIDGGRKDSLRGDGLGWREGGDSPLSGGRTAAEWIEVVAAIPDPPLSASTTEFPDLAEPWLTSSWFPANGALIELGDFAQTALVEAMRSPHPFVRLIALQALDELGPWRSSSTDVRVGELLAHDPCAWLRWRAARSLSRARRLEDCIPGLVSCLNRPDENPEVLELALDQIPTPVPPVLLSSLYHLRDHSDTSIRNQVMALLREEGAPESR